MMRDFNLFIHLEVPPKCMFIVNYRCRVCDMMSARIASTGRVLVIKHGIGGEYEYWYRCNSDTNLCVCVISLCPSQFFSGCHQSMKHGSSSKKSKHGSSSSKKSVFDCSIGEYCRVSTSVGRRSAGTIDVQNEDREEICAGGGQLCHGNCHGDLVEGQDPNPAKRQHPGKDS